MHSYDNAKYQYPLTKGNSSSVVPTSEVRTFAILVLLASCNTNLLHVMAIDGFINQAYLKMPRIKSLYVY